MANTLKLTWDIEYCQFGKLTPLTQLGLVVLDLPEASKVQPVEHCRN